MKDEINKIIGICELKSLVLLDEIKPLILSVLFLILTSFIHVTYDLTRNGGDIYKVIDKYVTYLNNATVKDKIEKERKEKEYMELLSLKLKVCDKEKELGYSSKTIFDMVDQCQRYKIKYDDLKQKYNKTTER
ncbi:hypothetical protein OQN31_23760 [Citrobacter freundii]|jgi:hypothetical protein|uniref:Uncharacterized protein n=1 Tax=Salmonella enterica subsp. enterica serovar Agona TaxID=58095 RepID=A0A6X7SEP8_SALET|nr:MULTISPECIES: hypothetical protein [Enterobacteriaceae]EAT9903188.1 hypothetical protein [Salmonella enterica]EBP4101564.1 hypothetical protein [Salmonella enterica subsp. enterica]EBU9107120.1 hypothetical protein [Salmonella enterica subsp. enterica serovar Virchow]ECC1580896.1 hypothetical protein [Salmonella enterica subsp. diarizonae]ECD1187118.1 hypothetical protein [Salmonella enterica subsp. enterica serovar Infantis]ECN0435655.1 hypothetical protein [Salmonella enterica subsp. ent